MHGGQGGWAAIFRIFNFDLLTFAALWAKYPYFHSAYILSSRIKHSSFSTSFLDLGKDWLKNVVVWWPLKLRKMLSSIITRNIWYTMRSLNCCLMKPIRALQALTQNTIIKIKSSPEATVTTMLNNNKTKIFSFQCHDWIF